MLIAAPSWRGPSLTHTSAPRRCPAHSPRGADDRFLNPLLALSAYAVWAVQPPGPAMGAGAWSRAAVAVVHMQINPPTGR